MRIEIFIVACYSILFQFCVAEFTDNSFLEENNGSECSLRIEEVTESNRNTQILSPSPLNGKWVSERCETRSGPRYILRSYTFYPNNSFHLIQFYYHDESCSSIAYTVSAEGVFYFKDSWTIVPSVKMIYDLKKVTVIAHDIPSANNLSASIYSLCPNITDRYWRPFVEYVIFKKIKKNRTFTDLPSTATTSNRPRMKEMKRGDSSPYSLACFSSIDLSFDELQTVRVQIRPVVGGINRHELLLSNTYLYSDRRKPPTRQKFQLPLVLVDEASHCLVCEVISRNTNMFVHQLPAKPKLPLFLNGEWISETCEMQPTGLYSRRILSFDQQQSKWFSEVKFYSNPYCGDLLAVHHSNGSYNAKEWSKKVAGAVNVDFHVQKSNLLIVDESFLDTIQMDPMCGIPNYWKIGLAKEIPSRYGCSTVGIPNPIMKHDIVRLDMDGNGSYMLYLGDESMNGDRPTSYKYPLLQCSSYPYLFQRTANVPSPNSRGYSLKPSFSFIALILCFSHKIRYNYLCN